MDLNKMSIKKSKTYCVCSTSIDRLCGSLML